MNIILLEYSDLTWPMGRMGDTTPEYKIGTGAYQRGMKVDPYPCYPPDLDLTRELVLECENAFPVKDAKLGMWLLSHEFIDRFNGITFEDYVYKREDGSEWKETIPCQCGCGKNTEFTSGQAITIALSGKRIPTHPAKLRYLVAHEYGHAVFDYIVRKHGYKDHDDKKIKNEYMKIRGVEHFPSDYSGGNWHLSPSEIIANDFRILFTNREAEFWPHKVDPPTYDSPIADWWRKATGICGLDARF